MAYSRSWSKRAMISSDSYWTKMCTYTTVKKAQIIDPKIALSHKAVMIGITAWILTGVFRDFNYVKTETPGMSVNPYIDQAGFYDQQTKLQAAPPWYCNNPKTDYNYSATWRYENNDCVFGLTLADVMTKTESAVFITTYFQDTPSDATSAAAAGLTAKNYFVPGVDQMMLWFDHSVITSWGTKVTNPSFDVTSFGSDAVLKSYTRGQEVGIKLEDLLAMTGANLDAENVASFGAPLYRITGLHVQMSIQYRNTHAGEAFDPDDVRGRGTVRYSPGVWTSLGPKIVYKKGSDGELHKFQRYHYVLRVSLEQGGEVGKFDFMTLLLNLAVASAMLGVAVTVVDTASEYLVGNFDDMKYDDRNDWMTLEALKAHALEQGILDKFAEDSGLELLEDDVMRDLKSRAQAKQERTKDALRKAAMVGAGLGGKGEKGGVGEKGGMALRALAFGGKASANGSASGRVAPAPMRGNMFRPAPDRGTLTPSPSSVVSRMLAEQRAMGLGDDERSARTRGDEHEDSDGDGEK